MEKPQKHRQWNRKTTETDHRTKNTTETQTIEQKKLLKHRLQKRKTTETDDRKEKILKQNIGQKKTPL